ncbi:c-type cytochrome [Burkholderia sp. Ac-20379]|uniref:c-type cytochrome n=1 Tax=Burkholderia sp. Ac-20379 TaxID=2703900 RepID=UPI0019816278|nr:cytochrome c [Burkholderia sp. Ac-20379]MBN3724619.1 cytochrome c [Burkholderia sp. Ac-20379]
MLVVLALFGALGTARAAQPETDQAQIARGRYLAAAADCAACHTAKGGEPFAGGLKMATPLGAIYSTNITPDAATGIGRYTEADFARAVQGGVARDGHNLYPAMPYTSYAKVSDDDVRALYAYFLHGVAPVKQSDRPVDIRWPLSMRWPMKVWNALFLDDTRFSPRPDRSVEWNRGAYLVEGLGHCSACHTARGVAFQEKAIDEHGDAFLAGAALDGWFASNLRGDADTGLGRWSTDDLAAFLGTGANAHATAFGPMTDVINHSTQWLTEADRHAMAVYLKSLPVHDEGKDGHAPLAPADAASVLRGARIYGNFCVACHLANGAGTPPYLAPLAGNPNLLETDPLSLINVTLNGADPLVIDGQPAPYPMPAHRSALDDTEVADVLTYLRNSWGNRAPAVSTHDVAAVRRRTGTQP